MTDAPAAANAAVQTVPTAHDRTFIPFVVGTDPEFDECLPDIDLPPPGQPPRD